MSHVCDTELNKCFVSYITR